MEAGVQAWAKGVSGFGQTDPEFNPRCRLLKVREASQLRNMRKLKCLVGLEGSGCQVRVMVMRKAAPG